MKVLTIVKNDRVTGVEYGMVEIGEPVSLVHTKKYNEIQKRKNMQILNHRTRQK